MENKEIKRSEELKEEELQNELSDEEMEKVSGGGIESGSQVTKLKKKLYKE